MVALKKIAGGRKLLLIEQCKESVLSCIDHLQYVLVSKGHTPRNNGNLLDLENEGQYSKKQHFQRSF